MSNLDIATYYFALSNQKKLDTIETLFLQDTLYNSDTAGEYLGKIAIMEMMRDFFEKFEYIHWDIVSITEINSSTVEIDFHAIFRNKTETKEKDGIETLTFNNGYIQSILIKSY